MQSKIDVGECRMLAPAPTAGMPRGLPTRVNNAAFFTSCWCIFVGGDNKGKVVTLIVAILSIMMTNTGQASPGSLETSVQCSEPGSGASSGANLGSVRIPPDPRNLTE